MPYYSNDNTSFEISFNCNRTYDEKYILKFMHALTFARIKKSLPIILANVKTSKDLRLLFQADCESTMKAIKSLPRIGEKTAWFVYNFTTKTNIQAKIVA